jgi:hypothetical protein
VCQAASVGAAAITTLAPGQRVPLLISQARAAGMAITAVSPHTGRQYTQILRLATAFVRSHPAVTSVLIPRP